MSAASDTEWLPSTQSRSVAVMLAVMLVVIIEAIGLHLWLRHRHPLVAWTFTGLSLLTLAGEPERIDSRPDR